MTKGKDNGMIRTKAFYDSLDEIDSLISEAAEILHKPKRSTEDMKTVEQLKNMARVKIGNNNTRRDTLVSIDKIASGFNKIDGIAASKPKKSIHTIPKRKTA